MAPDSNQLYVGWTEPGEWIRYTLQVKETGKYRIGLMYTANGDGAISFDIDDKPATGILKIFPPIMLTILLPGVNGIIGTGQMHWQRWRSVKECIHLPCMWWSMVI
ncbi:MAG: hypothetical protein WDO71_08495 [Bacteroidota bacterium]